MLIDFCGGESGKHIDFILNQQTDAEAATGILICLNARQIGRTHKMMAVMGADILKTFDPGSGIEDHIPCPNQLGAAIA